MSELDKVHRKFSLPFQYLWDSLFPVFHRIVNDRERDQVVKYPSTTWFANQLTEFFKNIWMEAAFIFPNDDFRVGDIWSTQESLISRLDEESFDVTKLPRVVVLLDFPSAKKKTHQELTARLKRLWIQIIHHSASSAYIANKYVSWVSVTDIPIATVKWLREIGRIEVENDANCPFNIRIIEEMKDHTWDDFKWIIYCSDATQRDKFQVAIADEWVKWKFAYRLNNDMKEMNLEGSGAEGVVFVWKFSLHNSTKGLMAAYTSSSERTPVVIANQSEFWWQRDPSSYHIDALWFWEFLPAVNQSARNTWKHTTERKVVDLGSVFQRVEWSDARGQSDEEFLKDAQRELVDNAKHEHQILEFMYGSSKNRIWWLQNNVPSYAEILKRRNLLNRNTLSDENLLALISQHLWMVYKNDQEYCSELKEWLVGKDYWEAVSVPCRDFFGLDIPVLKYFAIKKEKVFKDMKKSDQKDVLIQVYGQEKARAKRTEIVTMLSDKLWIEGYVDLLLYGNKIHGKNIADLRKKLLAVWSWHAFLVSEWIERPAQLGWNDIWRLWQALDMCNGNFEICKWKYSIGERVKWELKEYFKSIDPQFDFYTDFIQIPPWKIRATKKDLPYTELYFQNFVESRDFLELLGDVFPKKWDCKTRWRYADSFAYLWKLLEQCDIDSLWALSNQLHSWREEILSEEEAKKRFNDDGIIEKPKRTAHIWLKDLLNKSTKLSRFAIWAWVINARENYTPSSISCLISILQDNFWE